MVPELNNILGWVEQLGEVDVTGVEPMTAVIPQHAAPARRRGRCRSADRRRQARRGARQRACGRTRLLRRAEGDRMMTRPDRTRRHGDPRRRRRRATSPRAKWPKAFNANVAAAQDALNAFIVATPEKALEAADKVDADRAAGKPLGTMAGVPIGMKDLFATKGVQTTAASHILEGFMPEYESTVSQKLWDAGAGMLGKLNLDQFAMGSSNETSLLRQCRSRPGASRGGNAALAPGGSSGGISRGGRGAAVPGGDRHRHRRLDPPARRLHRHHRHQADLWPLLALGHRRLRQLARPGRADGARRARLRDHARSDGRVRSQGRDQPRPAGARLGSRRSNADMKGKRVGIPREYRMDGMDADDRQELGRGHRLAEGRRAPRSSRSACRTPNMRCPPITSSRPAEASSQPRALRRRALRPARPARRGRPAGHVRRDPRRRLRRRGQAPHPDRHLCAHRRASTTPITPRRRRSAR